MDGMKSPRPVQHLKGLTGVPQIDGCAGYSAAPTELFELDLAIDDPMQAGLTQGQCDLDRKLLLAGQVAFRERLPYRVLDLALRGDAELLEDLPHALRLQGGAEDIDARDAAKCDGLHRVRVGSLSCDHEQ